MNMLAPARTSYQAQDRVSTGFGPGLARPRAAVPAAPAAADGLEDGMASLDGIGLTRRLDRGQEGGVQTTASHGVFQLASGSNSFIARAIEAVSGPRFFWSSGRRLPPD